MKKQLILGLLAIAAAAGAAVPTLPFTTASGTERQRIFPTDGLKAEEKDGLVVHTRGKPGKHLFFRSMLTFKEPLKGDFAPEDALVLRLRVRKDTRIRVRWRKTDKTYVDMPMPELPLTGSPALQEIVLPLPEAPGKRFTTLFLEFTPAPGTVEYESAAIARPRNVTLKIAGNPVKVQKELFVTGTTGKAEAEVTVSIRNSRGEVKSRTVRSRNGKYELKWPRPPINLYAWNSVFATVNGGREKADVSIEHPLFGYRADDSHVWLKVKGRHIVTSEKAKGGEQIFIPVGLGYARDVILPAQDEEVMKFCRARGLNTIRLPFYTRFFNNRDSEPLDIDEHIRDFIVPVVQAAKRHNLYVILDDHGYFTSKIDEAKAREKQTVLRWSDAGFQEWIRRWVKVAEFFRDEPNVLGYELLNEPHDISPELTRQWYTRCLKAIRQVDRRHILLLGNCNWSHSRAMERTWGPTAKTVDAPYNNVVFSFHDYPEDNHPWDVDRFIRAFQKKHEVPVLCTEFGATHWNKSETVCRTFISGMLTLFAKEKVGWMIWALGRLEDNPRAPYNEVDKVGLNPPRFDSVAYSDQWIPAAKVMASPFPKAR